VSVIAALRGVDGYRLADTYLIPTLDLDLALEGSAALPPNARLDVVAAAARAGVASTRVQYLADTLIRPEVEDPATRRWARSEIVQRAARSKPGHDVLGRRPEFLRRDEATLAGGGISGSPGFQIGPGDPTLRVYDELLDMLIDEIARWIFMDEPQCQYQRGAVDSVPAISLSTQAFTTTSLEDLRPVIDPLDWPLCPYQHAFFRSMTPEPYATEPNLTKALDNDPDAIGWRTRLREVVDFSLGAGSPGAQFETFLGTSFFVHRDAANQPRAIGCTYDFDGSVGNRISVDQGFLIAEDLSATSPAGQLVGDLRRVRTLKQIHFTAGDPDDDLCPIWSFAAGMILKCCVS
jgi:hypothetical protein